jgi:hypothetical protein
MRRANLFETESIRPVNESRMRARWKLGQLLAIFERGTGPGRGKKVSHDAKSFMAYIKKVGLDKDTAVRAQRIGALPPKELDGAFAAARKASDLVQFSDFDRDCASVLVQSKPSEKTSQNRQAGR